MDKNTEKVDILVAFVNALLERSGGIVVLPMSEIEAVWDKSFKYAVVDNTLIFEVTE